ncbi:MAG: site-specific integrase [Bacillota bacterium]
MDNFQKRMLEEILKLTTILMEYTKEREQSGQAMGCAEIEKEISDMTKAKIRTRANGTYELRVRQDGVSKSIYGKTKLEVNKKFKKWRDENKTEKKEIQQKKKITFGEWFEEYLELYKEGKITPKTLSNIKSLVTISLYPTLENKELRKVTHKDIQQCINSMKAGHTSQKKLKYYISDIFKCAIRNKHIKENVAEGLTIAPLAEIKSEYLSQDQIQQLLNLDTNVLENRYFLFCLFTGARAGEGLRLRMSDIDREKRTIYLRGTKTKGARRTVPLFPNVEKLFPDGEVLEDRVFEKLNMRTMLKHFHLIIPDKTLKDLRTTFATICHEKGIPAKVVQKWMGHSKIDMTMNVYTKVRDDFEYEQAEKMV